MMSNKKLILPLKYMLQDRYRIKEVLEDSGLTVTYLAYDTFREKKVVIKEVCPGKLVERTSDKELRCIKFSDEMLFTEMKENVIKQAKIMIKLYPLEGIGNAITYLEENDTVYVVFEYIQGWTLADYLAADQGEATSLDSLLLFFEQFLNSLEKLNEAGVIHGRIRPDQIIITKKNGAFLSGFCEPVTALIEPVFLEEIFPARNSHYAPVELFMDKNDIKPSVDVYEVASTIYHCITGVIPPNFYDRIENTVALKTPWELKAGISQSQSKIITKAMASYSFERIQSIKQLLEGLKSSEDITLKERKVIHLYNSPFVFRKIDIYKKRKKILAAVIICCVLLAGGLKTASIMKQQQVKKFYMRFEAASLYERCNMLRNMAKEKRSFYANDYSLLTEGSRSDTIKYYDINNNEIVSKEQADFSAKIYSYITIDYRNESTAIITFYENNLNTMYSINLIRDNKEFSVKRTTIENGVVSSENIKVGLESAN